MKKIIVPSILLLALLAIGFYYQPEGPIANPNDYETFLSQTSLQREKEKLSGEIGFWEDKLVSTPGNYVFEKKLAGLFAKRFKLTGNPQDLYLSDSLFNTINQRIPGQVGVLQSLTANAITQHAFRKAEGYITEAYNIGEKRFATSLMMVDVLLERGQMYSASQYLKDVASDSHFDYLIRDVKFQDQKGDLEKAISQMEKAADKAKSANNDHLVNWSLSNLADMYGHDGQIKKSYNTYLKALSRNPSDLHSLKGIAWIAFSHDQNTAEAKRILTFLKSIHPVPDYDLLLAEIALFENDPATAAKFQQQFIAEASRPMYGNMYQRYICDLTSNTPNALAIAKTEIAERPHPLSYDLLAWASFQNGNLKNAVEITENHVMHHTSEPVALYHSGIILKEAGKYELAKKYLEEALEASFELGPLTTKEVQQNLDHLYRNQLASYHFQNKENARLLR